MRKIHSREAAVARHEVGSQEDSRRRSGARMYAVISGLLLGFALLQYALPVGTSVKIGADEGFELAKAVLSSNGHAFYTEVWNDQPPLHVFLLTQIADWISVSVLAARLLTVGLAAVLVGSVFAIGLRLHGALAGAFAVVLLLASPGFVELSCSVMQEVPALAPVVAALAVLVVLKPCHTTLAATVAGILFAVALQMKLIGVVYLPLVIGLLWLRAREVAGSQHSNPSPREGWLAPPTIGCVFKQAGTFVAATALAFLGVLLLTGETGSYLLQLKQSWFAHFAAARSLEYGTPDQHPFDWGVLLRHWDSTLPALAGIVVIVPSVRRTPLAFFPVAWLGLTLLVFGLHRPWWTYYYVHTAVPLSLCAAIGFAEAWRHFRRKRALVSQVALGLFMLAASVWMGARVYLQVASIRALPRIHSCLVLQEVARLRLHVRFLFTDEPIYSFHTRIPLPPALGVLSLKRFWSGDMTNARLTEELRKARPELLLLKNDTAELPYGDLIRTDYRLIYYDDQTRLYGLKEMLSRIDY